MTFKINKLPKSKISLSIVIGEEDMKKYADKAAENFASQVSVKGFRPGKAPKEIIIQHIGQERINNEILDVAVNDTYKKIIIENKIDTVGYPEIKIVKFVPNQELEYTAETAILPEIILADYKGIAKVTGKSEKQEIKVEEKEVENTLKWLADSHAQYSKLEKPLEINDEFAKMFGKFENLEQLKNNIRENILAEKKHAEKEKSRVDLISKIAEKSKMDIPEAMINFETDKMIHDLKHNLEHQKVEFSKYLADSKKTEEDLKKDFHNKAVEKIKIALVIKEIGRAENIKISDEELSKKIMEISLSLGKEKEHIDSERLRAYASDVLSNEKVFGLLGGFLE
ncbi:hypothetical protein HZC33_03035 [Candidatus Wolfebacteria bacterium]|nr:hypothetical protein [Candidatus Wolfebacteria bacterium]